MHVKTGRYTGKGQQYDANAEVYEKHFARSMLINGGISFTRKRQLLFNATDSRSRRIVARQKRSDYQHRVKRKRRTDMHHHAWGIASDA